MSVVSSVYLITKPLANKTPSEGIVLSITVLAVPIVLDLNKVVPDSGVPSTNSTSPAVPPLQQVNPLSAVLPPNIPIPLELLKPKDVKTYE